ncbi:MAG: flagellar hook-length control protein FliK [Chitinispirillaceae bacterium]
MINDTAQFFLQKPARNQRTDHVRSERRSESSDRSERNEVKRERSEKVEFGKVYQRVGKENRVATRSAESARKEHEQKAVSHDSDKGKDVQKSSCKQDVSVKETESDSEVKLVSSGKDEVLEECCKISETGADPAAEQAGELLKVALFQIASLLGIEISEDMENVSFEKLDQTSSGHFAKILWALEKIGGMLEEAAADGEMLQVGKLKLDPEGASELALLLKNQKFFVEMGLDQLGLKGKVNELLAEQFKQTASSGIPLATDPSDLTMTSTEINRLFGKSVQKDLQSAIEHIQKLLAHSGVKAQTESTEMQKIVSMMNAVDSKTMRAMLKLDGQKGGSQVNTATGMETVSSPKDAVEVTTEELKLFPEGKMDFSPEGENPVKPQMSEKGVKFTTDILNQLQAVKSDASANAEEVPHAVNQISNSASEAAMFQSTEKLSSALTRITDEAVMRQISEKMQSAVRSGVHELKIQLRPESLGEVRLNIRMENEVVFARIQVENQQVKQIIETHLQTLKDALEEQNIHAGSFSVDVGGRDGSEQRFGHELSDTASNWDDRGGAAGGNENLLPEEKVGEDLPGSDTGRRFGHNSFEYFV